MIGVTETWTVTPESLNTVTPSGKFSVTCLVTSVVAEVTSMGVVSIKPGILLNASGLPAMVTVEGATRMLLIQYPGATEPFNVVRIDTSL